MISQAYHRRERIKASIRIDALGCWIWTKSKSWNGYGRYATGGGGNARAHRISYEAFIGEIPRGLHVCHRCDVRACVNPEHLFVGTRSENLMDASRKGRLSRTHGIKGSAHPSSKLTEDQVEEIIGHLRAEISKKRLSKMFGVSQRTILLIGRGVTWKHVKREAA